MNSTNHDDDTATPISEKNPICHTQCSATGLTRKRGVRLLTQLGQAGIED